MPRSVHHRVSLRKLRQLLRNSSDLQVLCGAGISMISPTNLPSGNELRDICVKQLLTDEICKPYLNKLLTTKTYQALLPEAVLQDLGSTLGTPLDYLLVRVLRQASPNPAHKYLALNYPLLFTTNFDLCFEDAGAKAVAHLHGTISDPGSLQNQMYRLGKTALREMDQFRTAIKNRPLLILGYSLRDSDIVEAIADGCPSIVFYLSRSGSTPPDLKSWRSPLCWAKGSAEALFGLTTSRANSRFVAVRSGRQPTRQRRANALERLCFRAAQYDLEISVVKAFLPLLRGRSRIQALCGMANSLRVAQRYDESILVCRRVIRSRAAHEPHNADVLSTAYVVSALCDLDRRKKNYADIEHNFLEALRIFEALIAREKHNRHRVENDIWRARIFNNLGLVSAARGYHRKAIRYYLRSCRLKRRHFEEYGLAQTTSNLAKTYTAIGKLKLALAAVREVTAWMRKIPDAYICEDAILETLTTLQSRGLISVTQRACDHAAHYSRSWWRNLLNHAKKKHRQAFPILNALYELRVILASIHT
jgi:tetratricopeptide (TPR) repeat protein